MTKTTEEKDGLIAGDAEQQPLYMVSNARELALISLISPILFMGSLVSAAILVMSDLSQVSGVFWFWLLAQCIVCAALFLGSIREKTVLFSKALITESSAVKKFSFIALGSIWGVVPGVLALIEPVPSQLVMGSVLSGLTMSATLLLPAMPGLAKMLLTGIVGCFAANAFFYRDVETTSISLIMLTYFSVLAICARWYYARLSTRLNDIESAAAQARELSSVLKDVGHAADTYFWRTDADGILIETDKALADLDVFKKVTVGANLVTLFEPSLERDLLKVRMSRQSEIVALELEIPGQDGAPSSWWKLSARPVYVEGVFDGYRGAASSITSLKASEKRAAFLAEYDALTGLLNRSSFYRAVQLQLDTPPANDCEGGILWIDLDNFKWINDTFGHSGGDQVLQSVSERLQSFCEERDVVCRFGGDEFAVLATRSRQGDGLRQFVEELTEELAKPYDLESSEVQCSASIGFKRIGGSEDDATAATLMKEADLALYSAKSGGRATWKEYSEAFKARIRGQRELARDLQRAIGTNDLQLRFQPIVDGTTKEVIGVEALSRWFHPTRGDISPATFIQVAENNGMIIDLGDAVLEKAIEAAAELPDTVKVGINISPLQIHSSALINLIEEKLAATGVSANRIELEITESVFLSDNKFVLERLGHLKDLGLRIALDDFGTGFSSLAYLQRFPFDKLKLDQAFVRGIETSDQSCAIARATISMAHALNLSVTAEGVETEAQVRFLMEQGCDEMQGYLFARPQAQAELISALKEGAGRSVKPVHGDDSRIISMAGRKGSKS